MEAKWVVQEDITMNKKIGTWLLALGIATVSVVSVDYMNPQVAQAQAQSLQDKIINDAKSLIGTPYVFGGTTPRGFDCSGFLNYVYEQNGVLLPRTTADMYGTGTPISRSELQPGDLVFFTTYKPGASHSGIYLGNNQFIHSSSSRGIMISSLNESYWSKRYIGNRAVLDQVSRSSIQTEQFVAGAERSTRALRNYYMVTNLDQVQVSSAFENSYNQAKTAVNNAKSASLDSNQLNRISEADELLLRSARFFDAIKTGDELNDAKANLQSYINSEEMSDELEKVYDELSAEIRRTERAIGRVYGPSQRSLVGDKYILPAKIARETLIWEVTRYKLMKEMESEIANDQLEMVEENFALLNRLERRSVEIKEAGNQLHANSYPTLNEMESYLIDYKKQLEEAYQAKVK